VYLLWLGCGVRCTELGWLGGVGVCWGFVFGVFVFGLGVVGWGVGGARWCGCLLGVWVLVCVLVVCVVCAGGGDFVGACG